MADVERENNILKDGTVLNRRLEQIRELERENQQLRTELQTAKPSNSLAPDIDSIRDSVRGASASAEALRRTADRTLTKLKMGRQSAAGKAIDAFIRELQKPVTGNLHPKGEELNEVTQIQPPATWEARADDFLKEVAGNG